MSNMIFLEKSQTFVLHTKNSSYCMQVKKNYLTHLYYGAKIDDTDDLSYLLRLKDISFCPNPWGEVDRSFSLGVLPLEYPAGGSGDFRIPAFVACDQTGATASDLTYAGYEILPGKPKLLGLPSTFAHQGEKLPTLKIRLLDQGKGLEVFLYYTVFETEDVIARHVVVKNSSTQPVILKHIASGCLEVPDCCWDLISLPGTWAKERVLERQALRQGIFSVESKRGTSSHQNNPFIALAATDSSEDQGEVYGLTLVYSGNFAFTTEVSETAATRVVAGLNPYDFEWYLEPSEIFTAPELLLTFSDRGIGQMSRNFHDVIRGHLIRDLFQGRQTPVLINSWEASYFKFDQDSLLQLAEKAADLGMDLFVLDDGWFGTRNDDTTSLGDWEVNKEKFHAGLPAFIGQLKQLGMKFGIWMEPEMVSPDSELFRQHPDWCIHISGRKPCVSRSQLVLDFSRAEVVDYICDAVIKILSMGDITYVKWDMNRHLSDVGSAGLPAQRQRETWHRYVLGVYQAMQRITSQFPDILFESCSGGGGRFDAGMLYYMPQAWTSDNTDAIDRLLIQQGTSMVYPLMVMGTHVSAAPSHSVNRYTSLKTRGDVALYGTFGYELDLAILTSEEKAQVKHQIAVYHQHSALIRYGDYYRLLSPDQDNGSAWMVVSKDQKEALVCFVQILSEANALPRIIKLKGLSVDLRYRINDAMLVLSGRTLMNAGLRMEFNFGDFLSQTYYLKAGTKVLP